MESVFLLCAYTISAIISSIVGFGSSLTFLSLGSFIVPDIKVLLFAVTLGNGIKTAMTLYLFRDHIQWQIVKSFFPWAIIPLVLGAYTVISLPEKWFTMTLGILILGFTVWRFFKLQIPKLNAFWNKISASIWGFISGLVGAGGPVLVAIMSTHKLKKEAFVGTIQLVFFLSLLVKAPLYFHIEGSYTDLRLLGSMAILGVLGAYFGKWIHDRISEKHFEYVVLTLLFFAGIKMLF